jgi:ATP-dependent Clp protease adaptor protein ClpS
MPDKEQQTPQEPGPSQTPTSAEESAGVKTAEPKKRTARKSKKANKNQTKQLPPYNVVLLNDDDHTYEYVIEMLKALFGYPIERGYELAKEVDTQGRVIVLTTHKEKAELKRDQIHGYGADYRLSASKGPMTAMIEPAEA